MTIAIPRPLYALVTTRGVDGVVDDGVPETAPARLPPPASTVLGSTSTFVTDDDLCAQLAIRGRDRAVSGDTR
jgi:hypothetical protein